MVNFEKYLVRHGEFWVQAIVENIERHEKLHASHTYSLESRWSKLMGETMSPPVVRAA